MHGRVESAPHRYLSLKLEIIMTNHFRKYLLLLLVTLTALISLPGALFANSTPTPDPPTIAAKSYILLDADSGYIIAENTADQRVVPASLTKIMTTYVVFDALKNNHISLHDKVLISEKAWRNPGFPDWMKSSRMFVDLGSEVELEKLLRGLIIQSGNDAAVALAEHTAGSEDAFANMMNAFAEKLGMLNSHFLNSSGIPEDNHYSSAHDIALLSRALIRDFPEFYSYFSEKTFIYNNISQNNRNTLLWKDSSVDGIKTGHADAAGYCLAASAKRDAMRLIVVVMGTEGDRARTSYTLNLFNYGFRFFETHRLYAAGQQLHETRIWQGSQPQLQLGLKEDLYITIPRGQYNNLKPSLEIQSTITAPVEENKALGTISIVLNDKEITQSTLVALYQVPLGSFFQRASDYVLKFFE